MKTIYYIRHGESQANIDALASGAEMDSPLTDNGRSQAKKAARDLKAKGIKLIVCSPLSRTKETASIIAKEIGYDPNKILVNPLFTERRLGIYSGFPHADYLAAGKSGVLDKSVETTEEMYSRVQKGLKWLSNFKQDTILVVSHGGTGRMFRVINDKLHHSEAYKYEGFGNTEVFKLQLD